MRVSVQLLLVCAFWLLLRVLFFEGLWGYDDLYHVDYSLDFSEPPQNHWQTRVFFNGLLALAHGTLGFREAVLALPTLLGSLAFALATFYAVRSLVGPAAALPAALVAAALPIDVTHSTYPAANALANGFAAWGTALALTTSRPRGWVVGGMLLGVSIFTHLTFLFFGGLFGLACALLGWRRGAWVLASTLLTFAVLEGTTFSLLVGDPLFQFRIAGDTHLPDTAFAVPLRRTDGGVNPAWLAWPFLSLLFSKAFGFLLSVPVTAAFLRWRSREPLVRALVWLILGYWAWICFGSQHPFRYVPLDHDTRYWYPLALPGILLAALILRDLPARWPRWVLAGALVLPIPLLLLSSGTWGQNVEITRELIAFAAANPGERFGTDADTYDEMTVLGGGHPPPNVTTLTGLPVPDFLPPPPETTLDPTRGGFRVLLNPLNMSRRKARAFNKQIATTCAWKRISEPRYRLIAAIVPERWRAELVRKPPGFICAVGAP